MALPKAVEEAENRANELIAQLGQPRTLPAPEQPKDPEPKAVTPEVKEDQENLQAPAILDAEPEKLEQKLRVTQGRLRVVSEENRVQKAEIQALRDEVSQLKADLAAKPVAQPEADMEFTADEREKYDEDFVKFVKKVAKNVAPPHQTVDMSSVENRLRPLEEMGAMTAKEVFFDKLTKRSPTWETLNTDAGFLAWLADDDPLTGVSRQTLFNNAYASLDVGRVSNFFTTYSGQSTVGAAANSGLPSLDEQVVPSTGSSNPSPPPPGRIWTEQGIKNFYADVRSGRVTPEQAAAFEIDLFAAQREGRIR